MHVRIWLAGAVAVACTVAGAAALDAHITPEVIVRKQADVIRTALPTAARYTVTTIHISRSQLEQIINQAHYRPNTGTVKMYSGTDADGRLLGRVIFPQVDTQHGPIEVGVAVSPDGAVIGVAVTKVTVEVKPWLLDVERSGVLRGLEGLHAGDPVRRLPPGTLGPMPAYVAEAIETATVRALTLCQVLG